jgi:hypothetical protein
MATVGSREVARAAGVSAGTAAAKGSRFAGVPLELADAGHRRNGFICVTGDFRAPIGGLAARSLADKTAEARR